MRQEELNGIFGKFKTAVTKETAAELERALKIQSAEAEARLCAKTLPQMREIADKIHREIPLLPDENELIRLWVIGEQETYVRTENDFQNWQTELERLRLNITVLKAKPEPNFYDLIKLRGSAQDALYLLGNIARYVQQQNNVKEFERGLRAMVWA